MEHVNGSHLATLYLAGRGHKGRRHRREVGTPLNHTLAAVGRPHESFDDSVRRCSLQDQKIFVCNSGRDNFSIIKSEDFGCATGGGALLKLARAGRVCEFTN